MKKILVPEHVDETKNYFITNINYNAGKSNKVYGYSLYSDISCLDRISKSPIVVAVQDKFSSAHLYEAEAYGKLPADYEKTGDSVVCIKKEKLLDERFVKVESKNWSKCELKYHVIAALYRIGIIPDLKNEIFEDKDIYDRYVDRFFNVYKMPKQKIEFALSCLFSEMLFLLSLFGFAVPHTENEQDSLTNAQKLFKDFNEMSKSKLDEKQNLRYFAFTEIKFVIKNYLSFCFPNHNQRKDIMNFEAYDHLQKTLIFLVSHLIRLNYLSDKSINHNNIFLAVRSYQKENNIHVGNCDFKTLRHILNQSMGTECSLYGICNLCGTNVSLHDIPTFYETIGTLKSNKNDQNLGMVSDFMNDVFNNVYTHREITYSYITTLKNSTEKQIKSISNIKENSNKINKKIQNIKDQIIENINKNTVNKKEINNTIRNLDEIIEIHKLTEETFMKVQKRIEIQTKGNLLLLSILLFLLYILVFHKF